MSQTSLKEYIPRVRSRYLRLRGKRARSRLLDEFCTVSGFERKYASKVLSGERRTGRGGAPRLDGAAEVAVLVHCWGHMEPPAASGWRGCRRGGWGHLAGLEDAVRSKLLAMSAATIDRLLARVKLGREESRWHHAATQPSKRAWRSGPNL